MKSLRSVLVFVLFLLTTYSLQLTAGFAEPLLIDDFEGGEIQNRLGGRANIYVRAPSRIMLSRAEDEIEGLPTQVLMLRYDKKSEGGPYDMGGWCGYYTLLKTSGYLVAPTPEQPSPPQVGEQYLDASGYQVITFWVRGEKGDENFMVGLADRHWDRVGDSVKSEEIGKYIPGGRITTEWKKAAVPLSTYFLDYVKLASVAICFEGELYPEGAGHGTVYIDNIALE